MPKFIPFFAALCLTFLPSLGSAANGIAQLKEFQREVQSLRANFYQVVVDAHGELVQESAGEVFLQRPNRFRWDYKQPYPQLIVGDGNKVWIYDTDLEQVTIKPMDQVVSNAPALILGGKRALEEDFTLVAKGEHDGVSWVELQPKEEQADFRAVRLGFADGLQRMELEDNFGQFTRIHFRNLVRNPKLDPDLFQFNVPEGVDVVGDAAGAASGRE